VEGFAVKNARSKSTRARPGAWLGVRVRVAARADAELLQAIADGRGSVVGSDEAYPELLRVRALAQAALAVASGAAVEVPLRVLVEWALRGRGWERSLCDSATCAFCYWYDPDDDSVFGGRPLASAVSVQIEREEAAPAAEATT
jgi:hypothetical protein